MELKQLRYFVTLAEHLNFSRAAEALYISQPALSYQIAELEKELDTELFLRDKRKVYLTAAGAAILDQARHTLEAAEELRRLAKQPDTGQGRLLIGLEDTEDHFECTGITAALARFMNQYPRITMEFQQLPFSDCVARLEDGSLDLAFLILRHGEQLPAELRALPVRHDRQTLVIRRDETVQTCTDVVRKYDLLLVTDKPRGHSRALKSFEGLSPTYRYVDSVPASFIYAQAGLGAMVLPHHYFALHDYQDLMSVEIPGDAARLTHAAVWNRTAANSAIGLLCEMLTPMLA